jgi:hypothetical protein
MSGPPGLSTSEPSTQTLQANACEQEEKAMKQHQHNASILPHGGRTILARGTQLAITVALLVVASAAFAQRSNPRVMPPGSTFRGLTYGEWAAQWWTTAFAIPVVDGAHPLFSGGIVGESKGVVFLATVGGGVTIDVTIPVGQSLFFPILNAECSVLEPDPFHGDNEAELRACANGHIDSTSDLFAEIDGAPVSNLGVYRVESPLFEFGPLPPGNLFEFLGLNAPAGTTSPAVDAGVYLLMAPLSPGKHTVQVKGTINDLGFSVDTKFHITVN